MNVERPSPRWLQAAEPLALKLIGLFCVLTMSSNGLPGVFACEYLNRYVPFSPKSNLPERLSNEYFPIKSMPFVFSREMLRSRLSTIAPIEELAQVTAAP